MARPAVNVVITGDTKGLEKSLKKSGGALGSFGKTAAGVFGGLALAKGVGLVVDGVQALGGFALEGVQKLDALGDATARLDTLAKGLGKTATSTDLTKWGVDKGEAADSALAIAKMGNALGLTDPQLRKVTPGLQKMAAQLASLGDGDPVKQAELLSKALAGNAKAAKALGIHLPKGATGLEAYQSVVKQLGPQLDKATAGNASLADVGDRFDATLANLQLELGGMLDALAPVISQLLDVLLPVLHDLVDTVGPMVAELFAHLSDALSGFLEDGGASGVANVFGTIADVLGRLAAFVVDNVVPVFLELGASIADNLAPLLPKLQEAFDALLPVLERVWGFVQDVVVPLLTKYVIPLLGKVLGIALDLVVAFLKKLGPAIDTLSDMFADLVEFLQPVIDALGTVVDLAGKGLGAIGGIIGGHGIPGAATSSSSAAQLSGGVHITVQTGVGDPVAIGRTVARYLGAYTGRGGGVPSGPGDGAARLARATTHRPRPTPNPA